MGWPCCLNFCVGACSAAPPPLNDEAIRRSFEEAQVRTSSGGIEGRHPTEQEIGASRAFAGSPEGRRIAEENGNVGSSSIGEWLSAPDILVSIGWFLVQGFFGPHP